MGIYHTDQESLKVYNTGGGGGGGDSTAANQTTEIDRLTTISADIAILKGYLDGVEGKLDSIIAGVLTTVAHDAAATTVNPVLIGGYASASAPSDVSADGDAVRTWFHKNGALAVFETNDGTAVTGTVTSAATLFTQDMLGYESITVQVTSAGSACTITYETCDDNSTWIVAPGIRSDNLNGVWTTTSTGAFLYRFPKGGRYFRARVSTYGSGTVTIVGSLHKEPFTYFSNTQVQGLAGSGSAVAGNPNRIGAQARTSNYTALTTGNTSDLISTLVGALIQKPYSIPEADWTYAAAASGIANTTTAVAFQAAAAAGLRNYITGIHYMSQSLTNATELAIRDGAGGTVLWRTAIPATTVVTGVYVHFSTPLRGTAATLLEVLTLTASGAGAVYFNAQGYIAP